MKRPCPFKNLLDPLKKTPSLKVTLAGAVMITISTTAAIVYVPWLLVSQRNVDMLIAQTNKEIALATSQEVERLFSSAQSAQGLIQSSYINNFVHLADQKAQEAFLVSALQANPDFTWVQFGYPILRVAPAAAAIEAQKFEVESLSPVAQRTDELGQLARVFQTMARQIYVREQRLKQLNLCV